MVTDNKKKKIWIDIDNTPHVVFFNPIIKELRKNGIEIIITARNYGGIVKLLRDFNIEFIEVGKDNGFYKIEKIYNVVKRILNLYFVILKFKKEIAVSISHGSRAHVGAAWLLNIPSITSYDYEHSSKIFAHTLANIIIIPKLIPDSFLLKDNISLKKFYRYDGFKEQIYLNEFIPDRNLLNKLSISSNRIIVLVRPPAFNSHYFTEKSGILFKALIKKLEEHTEIHVIFSPRNIKQKTELVKMASLVKNHTILQEDVDGLSLLWNSDIVFSGGGTMNREAALLGIPVYSIFGGKMGYLDKELLKLKRLKVIEELEELKLIQFEKRKKNKNILKGNIRDTFINHLMNYLK